MAARPLITALCKTFPVFALILAVDASAVFGQQQASPSDTLPLVLQSADEAAPAALPAEVVKKVPPPKSVVVSTEAPALATPALIATAADPLSRDLQQILIQAMGELDTSRMPSLEHAKERLQNALVRLERYVGLGTERGRSWAKFLRLDEIKQAMNEERLSLAKFVDYEMNTRQNYLGLEYPPYLELRDALNELVRAIKYGTDTDRTLKLFEARITDLVETLNEPADGAGAKRASDVGLVTSYLIESGQSPASVARIRDKFMSSNATIYVRQSLLDRLLARSVAEPSPVNECLLGTRILGQACLTGVVSADILPMTGGVSLNLNLSANLSTKNVGYNRGVLLRTTGTSPVYATKQVFVTPTGVSSAPVRVATNLNTQINSIEHRLRIVRRIAQKKAAEQKPLADSIAEGRLQNRLASQYDERVNEQLAEANTRLQSLQQPRPALQRFAIPQPTYAIYSTDHEIQADVVHAASYQLAATGPCKIPKPISAEVVVEAHQSLAINLLENLFAGRTIHNHDLDDLAQQLLGEVPPEVMTEVNGKSWEITLATFNPIQLALDDNCVTLTLRITQMQGEDRTLGNGAIIAATYEPSYRDGILTLRRVGDLDIEVPGVRSSFEATNLRSVVRAKFDPVFKPEIVTEKLDLTKLFPNARDFAISSIHIDDGWLQVGVR